MKREPLGRLKGLRYLLIWPALRAAGRRSRQSLTWRLAISHLLTVVFSLTGLLVMLLSVGLVATLLDDPASREPAADAQAVARVFGAPSASLDVPADPLLAAAVLQALAHRDVKLDREMNVNITFASLARLKYVRSVSIVDASGRIAVSSDTSLMGQPVSVISPAAPGVTERALHGSRNLDDLSTLRRSGESAAVGAFPLPVPGGDLTAVVVDKSRLASPRGWGLLPEVSKAFLSSLGISLLAFALPAIVVAFLIAVPRARAIVRPVRDLSGAATALAEGDLHQRVDVHGDDEVAALGRSFNGMAAHLDETISEEAAQRSRAEERTRELTALLEVSHAVASTLELQPLVSLILDQLRLVMDYTGASLLTLEDDDLVVLDARAVRGAEAERGMRFPVAEAGAIWRTILRMQPVMVHDVRGEGRLAADYRMSVGDALDSPSFAHVRSWMAVPLAVKERVIGSLALSRDEPGAFDERHVRLARAVADQAALAIENARLYQQAASLAALEERTRLARDLHDSVTQSVFSLGMLTRAAQTQHARGGASLGKTLDRISTIAGEALAEMRALLFELRPGGLAEDGLCDALEKLVSSFRTRSDIAVSCSADTDVRLAPETETAIFRIVQEALGNAMKHSQAREVSVSLEQDDSVLRVEVIDNGVGFDPATPVAPSEDGRRGGMGLTSMRERAAAAGLTLRVESSPGTGTAVIIETPVPVLVAAV